MGGRKERKEDPHRVQRQLRQTKYLQGEQDAQQRVEDFNAGLFEPASVQPSGTETPVRKERVIPPVIKRTEMVVFHIDDVQHRSLKKKPVENDGCFS